MRILVADDDEISALVLSERLEDLGYQVTVARDGEEAWQRLQQTDYPLLILDWMMPKLDGMEVCRRVREINSECYTYIILLTAKSDRRDRLEALEGGADDFLTKPLDPAELFARLKAANRVLSSDEALRNSNRQLQSAREKELETGANIQQRLLHSAAPESVPCLQTVSVSLPSQTVDGDFCDFFDMGDVGLDVVVGDVMGKGVPAALVGAGVKTNLQRAMLRLMTRGINQIPSPSQLIQELSRHVSAELIGLNTFLTLCYARFNTADGTMRYVNCGHPRLVLWRAASADVTLLETTSVPLGFMEAVEYDEREVQLSPGDLVVFYSDGVTDLSVAGGGRLRVDGFARWVEPRGHLPLEAFSQALIELRESSDSDAVMRDDFTCVAVRYVGNEKPIDGELSVWADAHSLREVRAFIKSALEATRLGEREKGEVLLAVQECASNAVRHARLGHHALPLKVVAAERDGGIEVTLEYPGVEFDPESVPPPPTDDSRDGGFGVAIIKKCMDEIAYISHEGLNRVTLVKRCAE